MRRRAARLIALAAALWLAPAVVLAQDEPPAHALTGALKRIKDTGTVRIGYRENAVPFSYATRGGQPLGYSIDLCLAIVEDLAMATGARKLNVEYRKVTPADRLQQVADGRIDLECGSTTITQERRKSVAFSPVTFIAGTRLMVKKGGGVHGLRDLPGKTVVAVAGTSNARSMLEMAAGKVRGLRVLTAATYEEALRTLEEGGADAMAADDVLLAGFVAERKLQGRYLIIGHPMTLDPYGIAFARGDAPMADAVQVTFSRLASSGELRTTYNRWFTKPLPSGIDLDWPMGAELKRAFEMMGQPAD